MPTAQTIAYYYLRTFALICLFNFILGTLIAQGLTPSVADRAKAEIKNGTRERAFLVLEEGIQKNPRDYEALKMLNSLYSDKKDFDGMQRTSLQLIAYFPDQEYQTNEDVFQQTFRRYMGRFRDGDEKTIISALNKVAVFRGASFSQPADLNAWKASWQPFCQGIVQSPELTQQQQEMVDLAGASIVLDYLVHASKDASGYCQKLLHYQTGEILRNANSLYKDDKAAWQLRSKAMVPLLVLQLPSRIKEGNTSSVVETVLLLDKITPAAKDNCVFCSTQITSYENFKAISSLPLQQRLEKAYSILLQGQTLYPDFKTVSDQLHATIVKDYPVSKIAQDFMIPKVTQQLQDIEGNFASYLYEEPAKFKDYINSAEASIAKYQIHSLESKGKDLKTLYEKELPVLNELKQLERNFAVAATSLEKLKAFKPTIDEPASKNSQSILASKFTELQQVANKSEAQLIVQEKQNQQAVEMAKAKAVADEARAKVEAEKVKMEQEQAKAETAKYEAKIAEHEAKAASSKMKEFGKGLLKPIINIVMIIFTIILMVYYARTPEGDNLVPLQSRVGFPLRLLASVIDAIPCCIMGAIVIFILSISGGIVGEEDGLIVGFVIGSSVFAPALSALYFASEAIWGTSLGKLAVGLKIIPLNGGSLWRRYFMKCAQQVLMLIAGAPICLIALLTGSGKVIDRTVIIAQAISWISLGGFLIFSARKQTLWDHYAKTVVIKKNPQPRHANYYQQSPYQQGQPGMQQQPHYPPQGHPVYPPQPSYQANQPVSLQPPPPHQPATPPPPPPPPYSQQ